MHGFIRQHFSTFNVRRFILLMLVAVIAMPIVAAYDLLLTPGVKLFLAFLTVFAAIDLFALLTKHFDLYLLRVVGRNTLPIYVMHMFFVLTVGQYIVAYDFAGSFAHVFAAIAPPVLTLMNTALCLSLYMVLNRHQGRVLFTLPSYALLFRAKPDPGSP